MLSSPLLEQLPDPFTSSTSTSALSRTWTTAHLRQPPCGGVKAASRNQASATCRTLPAVYFSRFLLLRAAALYRLFTPPGPPLFLRAGMAPRRSVGIRWRAALTSTSTNSHPRYIYIYSRHSQTPELTPPKAAARLGRGPSGHVEHLLHVRTPRLWDWKSKGVVEQYGMAAHVEK